MIQAYGRPKKLSRKEAAKILPRKKTFSMIKKAQNFFFLLKERKEHIQAYIIILCQQ